MFNDFVDMETDEEVGKPFAFGNEDRQVIHPERFSAEELDSIKTGPNGNNSDVDFCEYHGKTYITYSWGNQLGNEFLALAEYDGSLEDFLKSYF